MTCKANRKKDDDVENFPYEKPSHTQEKAGIIHNIVRNIWRSKGNEPFRDRLILIDKIDDWQQLMNEDNFVRNNLQQSASFKYKILYMTRPRVYYVDEYAMALSGVIIKTANNKCEMSNIILVENTIEMLWIKTIGWLETPGHS